MAILSKCKCGGQPSLFDSKRGNYVLCPKCHKRTTNQCCPEDALADWIAYNTEEDPDKKYPPCETCVHNDAGLCGTQPTEIGDNGICSDYEGVDPTDEDEDHSFRRWRRRNPDAIVVGAPYDPFKWTVEPHGNGYALYEGRDQNHHGLNLVYLTDLDSNWARTLKLIELGPVMYGLCERLSKAETNMDVIKLVDEAELVVKRMRDL
jgi:hypothetical protein